MKKSITILILSIICHPLMAATFNIPNGDVAALVTAMTTANNNGQADIINLANNGTYIFTTVNNTVTVFGAGYIETNGPVALPVIQNEFAGSGPDLIINLNGSVLSLSSSGARMRLFQGDSDASFQVNGGTIKDFESPGNNPTNGQGGSGAGVVVGQRGTFSSNGMIFDNCKSNSREERAGGAIAIGGSANVTLKNCTFKNNSSGPNFNSNGGAITGLYAKLYVENCTFENNTAPNATGAALFIDGCGGSSTNPTAGMAEFVNCTFTNNISQSHGGAMYLQGYHQDKYFIKNCQFTNNKSSTGQGGAIWNSGPSGIEFNVSGSTFENNKAKEHAGAIRCTNGSTKFTNSTFYGNEVTNGGASGGAYFSIGDVGQTRFTTIENCTFANNVTGGYGGAWVIADGNGSVKNTIIANNTSNYNNGNNCFNTLANGGNNIEYPENTIGNKCFTRAVVPNSNAMPVINPLILPLAFNGGNTKTMALQATSPAINAGNGCSPTDQRGAPRVGNCDIGAYEYGSNVLSIKEIVEHKNNLVVYPNPSTGNFFIKVPKDDQSQRGSIQIFSLDGKLILSKDLNDDTTPLSLSIKGVYILKITIGDKLLSHKILIN